MQNMLPTPFVLMNSSVKKSKTTSKPGSIIRYIGDWHTHPFTKLKPSKTDKRTLGQKAITHYQTSSH